MKLKEKGCKYVCTRRVPSPFERKSLADRPLPRRTRIVTLGHDRFSLRRHRHDFATEIDTKGWLTIVTRRYQPRDDRFAWKTSRKLDETWINLHVSRVRDVLEICQQWKSRKRLATSKDFIYESSENILYNFLEMTIASQYVDTDIFKVFQINRIPKIVSVDQTNLPFASRIIYHE